MALPEEVLQKAENFASQYAWSTEFSRQSFIDTLVIQDETIQELKKLWYENSDGENDAEIDSNEYYRNVVDTINAHYMEILTDLLNSASPLKDESK